MKTYDADTLAALDAGQVASRGMILFDLPSGLYGFWDGLGTLDYQGVPYKGSGDLIELSDMAMAADLSSIPLVAKLSAKPDSELSPGVLATIEDEQYHQRPVVVSRCYIDIDTRALLSVERLWRGYIDRIEHQEEIDGGYVLVAYLESKSRDHGKRGHRTRSDADQRRIDPTDTSLVHAATAASQEITWGRKPETATPGKLGTLAPPSK